jgi:hypothetical protein
MRAAAFAFLATIALAACAPQDGGGRLEVRTLEVRATSADSMVFEGAAVDSTWTIPGDDARQLTRSLVLEPGDGSETPSRLLDIALGALVTGFAFLPPGELADDATEEVATGLLEVSLQQGIAFRTAVVANYSRGEDLAWRGTANFTDRMVWIDSRETPADTLRLALEGDFEDVRGDAGGQQVLRAQGTLYVATAGEYTLELTERVEAMEVSAEGVARMMGGVRDELEP